MVMPTTLKFALLFAAIAFAPVTLAVRQIIQSDTDLRHMNVILRGTA
jgi:hypothetical protein